MYVVNMAINKININTFFYGVLPNMHKNFLPDFFG